MVRPHLILLQKPNIARSFTLRFPLFPSASLCPPSHKIPLNSAEPAPLCVCVPAIRSLCAVRGRKLLILRAQLLGETSPERSAVEAPKADPNLRRCIVHLSHSISRTRYNARLRPALRPNVGRVEGNYAD